MINIPDFHIQLLRTYIQHLRFKYITTNCSKQNIVQNVSKYDFLHNLTKTKTKKKTKITSESLIWYLGVTESDLLLLEAAPETPTLSPKLLLLNSPTFDPRLETDLPRRYDAVLSTSIFAEETSEEVVVRPLSPKSLDENI